MQFTTKLFVLAALTSMASAHLRMDGSFPPKVVSEPSNPLKPNGADYPCAAASYGKAPKNIAKGQNQKIQLRGTAVHGGGSCQVSITYDANPNKNSKFRVIKSFQGGCPMKIGGNIEPGNPEHVLPGLTYQIPEDAPAGRAVLAWTWFNRVGNREMYMRCAPIQITGSAGDQNKFSQRPEIFKANIGNGCSTPANMEINFPNPGSNVVGKGNANPTGSCGRKRSYPVRP